MEQHRSDFGQRAPADAERPYVNAIHIDIALSQILFDLRQSVPGDPARDRVFPFITSAEHLVTIGEEIATAVTRYRDRFGEIARGPERRNG